MKVESEEWEMKMGVVIVYLSLVPTGQVPPPNPVLDASRDLVPRSHHRNLTRLHKHNDVTRQLLTLIYENKCQSGTPARISIHRHHRSRHPTHQAIHPSSPSNSFISVKSVMPFGVISVSASKSPVTFVQIVSLTSRAPT